MGGDRHLVVVFGDTEYIQKRLSDWYPDGIALEVAEVPRGANKSPASSDRGNVSHSRGVEYSSAVPETPSAKSQKNNGIAS